MIAVLSRIAARYVAGALVAYGLIPSEMADQLALDPDVALAIGFALTAVTEGAYTLAKRLGWAT